MSNTVQNIYLFSCFCISNWYLRLNILVVNIVVFVGLVVTQFTLIECANHWSCRENHLEGFEAKRAI